MTCSGLAWGRTVNATTGVLSSLARCTVVQMTGAAGNVGVTEDTLKTCVPSPPSAEAPPFPSMHRLSSTTRILPRGLGGSYMSQRRSRRLNLLTKALVAVGSMGSSQLTAASLDVGSGSCVPR